MGTVVTVIVVLGAAALGVSLLILYLAARAIESWEELLGGPSRK